jgi:hypothetical protein
VGDSVDSNENINREITNTPKNNQATVLSKTYITPYYQISYPESYVAELFRPSDRTLSSLYLTSNADNAKIEITVSDISSNSQEEFSRGFDALGYKRSLLTVGNLTGQSFEGTIKGIQLYEHIALLIKGSALIRIQLMQQGGPTDNINQTFLNILNSLQ